MAAKSDQAQLMRYGIGAGVVYITYNLALNGSLGSFAQYWANQIQDALKIGDVTIPGSGGSGSTSNKCGQTANGNVSAMRAGDSNFDQHVSEWKAERKARNENAYDWAAFRTHLTNITGFDPGATPPAMFCS